MTATAHPLPPTDDTNEVVDFLRRLASMLTGGRNAEMLLGAADIIEQLTRRAATAEQSFREQQGDHARNLELREVAELASHNLAAEVNALKAQLDAEVNALKAQLAESEAKAETERGYFAEESSRLVGLADEAKAKIAESNDRLLRVNAEIEELRNPPTTTIDESIAIVPIESLQLARTQFGYLAQGFAKNGDVVSQTICEIGARAIDKALAGDRDTKPAN
jgi:hypothetical protein